MTGAQLRYALLEATNREFDVMAPYSGCWLCGDVFQSATDRMLYELSCDPRISEESLAQLRANADRLRDEWRTRHSEAHSKEEHEALARSPELCTVEAANKLAPLGIFPIEHGKEIAEALIEAPRVYEGRIHN